MAASSYCDLPRDLDTASRLTLAEHIIDALSRSLQHRVLLTSNQWRWEKQHWGLYVYATIQLFDYRGQITTRGLRFRVTSTFLGIQGGSSTSTKFDPTLPPPADAPRCPAADTPQLAELNSILKRVGTPLVIASRARDTSEHIALTDPSTSRLGALDVAPLADLQRHGADPSASTSLFLQPPTVQYQPTHHNPFPAAASASASESATTGPTTRQYTSDRAPIAPIRRATYATYPQTNPSEILPPVNQHPAPYVHSSFGSPVDAQPRSLPVSAQLQSLRHNLARTFGGESSAAPTPDSVPNHAYQLPPPPHPRPPTNSAQITRPNSLKRRRPESPDLDPDAFLPEDEADESAPPTAPELPAPFQQPHSVAHVPPNFHSSDIHRIADSLLDHILPRIARALAPLLQWHPDAVLIAMQNPPPPHHISFNAPSQTAQHGDQTAQPGLPEE